MSSRRRPSATCRSSSTSTAPVGGPLMTARRWTDPESSPCRPWQMVSIRLDSNKYFFILIFSRITAKVVTLSCELKGVYFQFSQDFMSPGCRAFVFVKEQAVIYEQANTICLLDSNDHLQRRPTSFALCKKHIMLN